jgi:hypothetical protein
LRLRIFAGQKPLPGGGFNVTNGFNMMVSILDKTFQTSYSKIGDNDGIGAGTTGKPKF